MVDHTDPERCILCPPPGPPQPERQSDNEASKPDLGRTAEVDLIWIACGRCNTWYHSACLLLSGEEHRSTLPDGIVEEVENNHKDQGAWFDWTIWVDKWFCQACIEKVAEMPRPPRRPVVAKLKAGYPPFVIPERKNKRKSMFTSSPVRQMPTKLPRSRHNARSDLDGRSVTPEQGANDLPHDATGTPSTAQDGTPALEGEQTQSEGRPKRNVKQLDYHNLNNSIATPTHQWLELIANPAAYGRVILDAEYKHVPGHILSKAWLECDPSSSNHKQYPPTLFYGPDREPIIVGPEGGGFKGMGGTVPGKDLTVQDVARLVGPKRMVDVIDVSSQQSTQWTLQKWADYLSSSNNPSASGSHSRSNKIYNIISLEISDTELGRLVKPPRLVKEIDWVDNFWNFAPGHGSREGKGRGKGKDKENANVVEIEATNGNANGHDSAVDEVKQESPVDGQIEVDVREKTRTNAKAPYPKVQLYCLMGMRGAWTDWHVDFAASSVYYTIHTGSKVFYFIRPTPANLKAYTEWSGSYEKQQDTWLGDMVDEVRKVVLKAGDTMIIPAGYIHAVYTPMDSIVFGGNFIHSYDIDTQLRLRQIEIDTKVPQRFRFPMFEKLCWFVADSYVTSLRQHRAYRPRATSTSNTNNLPSQRVLKNLVFLANFLISQIAILHNPDKEDKSKKLVYDRIPHDVVKDGESLAMELKWRVFRELVRDEENQGASSTKPGDGSISGSSVGHGRTSAVPSNEKERERELKRKQGKLGKVFERAAVSRTWKFDPPEWTTYISPAKVDKTTQTIPRPSSSSDTSAQTLASITANTNSSRFYPVAGEPKGEPAEVTTSHIKQIRRRVREFESSSDGIGEGEGGGGGGGGTVLEEQEVTFVEKKVVWGLIAGNSGR